MLDHKGEKGNLDLYVIEIVRVCSKVGFKIRCQALVGIEYPSSRKVGLKTSSCWE